MATVYKYKKCNVFGFSRSLDTVINKYNNCIIYNNDNYFKEFDKEFIDKNKESFIDPNNFNEEDIPTFIIDLTSSQFDDINILTDEKHDNNNNNIKTNNADFKRDDGDLRKIVTGQSSQLEAFSKNIYSVIYGKKTANIQQGKNNAHIFNHNVIDSLAKNGIICDQTSEQLLSVHLIFNELEKLRKFNIFFIHPKLDIEYVEQESPSEISHPVYIKGEGEITAVFYRTLVLRFFPYLTIVTESMRENAYLF